MIREKEYGDYGVVLKGIEFIHRVEEERTKRPIIEIFYKYSDVARKVFFYKGSERDNFFEKLLTVVEGSNLGLR
jgi:hypothetical protein